jgi:lysophospholipase L1-like esterase
MADLIPATDASSFRWPLKARERLALDLADPGTPEGAVLADAVATQVIAPDSPAAEAIAAATSTAVSAAADAAAAVASLPEHLDTEDGAIAALVGSTSSQTRAALSDTYAAARTVDMLAEGASADGITDDLAVFTAARTKAGAKGIVHFPAKKGAASTTYFLAGVRPDLSGTQITTDPTVVLKMDASPNLKTFGFLTDVTVENTAHSSTLRKRHALDLPVAIGMAANVRPQQVDLTAIDLTTWESLAVEGSALGVRTFGTFTGTVTADQVSWASAFAAGTQGKFVVPQLGALYEACVETTKAGSNTNNDTAGIMILSADNHSVDVRMPRSGVSPLIIGSADFATGVGGTGITLTLPGQYGLPSTSGGVNVGVRLLGAREAEFYANGRMFYRLRTLKDIAKVGFVAAFPDSNLKTIHHAVSYGTKFVPTSARRCTVSIVGDSISYGAWTPITYGDLLPIAFAGLPGGGGVNVRQNIAVSGSTAQQWGTAGGTQDIATKSFAGDDYVLVMLGTNDGQALRTVADYLTYVAYIAAKIIADGSRPVFGQFPLWWSTGATGVPGAPGVQNSGRAASLRAALTSFCAKNGYPLALVQEAIGDVYEWLPDNIHPDERGQAAVARAFAQAIARDRMRQLPAG